MSRLPKAEISDSLIPEEPEIDFWKSSLSITIRRKFAAIDESRQRHPSQKMALARLLLNDACDRTSGTYVPLSSHPFLTAKLTEDFSSVPTSIRADIGTSFCLFGNPLLLPPGFDDAGFDITSAVKPSLRATNCGFVVATIEYDCETREQFEQICASLDPAGSFKEVDAELRAYRDYHGYTVVLTGNRSLHYHFVFYTKHLKEAPHQQPFESRCQSYSAHSAFMSNVHQVYWNTALEVMQRVLSPPVAADGSMASYTQFKRTPWGVRKLEKDSDILGLPKGTLVPQLVLAESIRTGRSSKGSHKYIVSSDFSVPQYLRARKRSSDGHADQVSAGPEMVNELASICRSAWGSEFPKPVRVTKDRGQWIIHFQNHAMDGNPSTVARGEYTTLHILGQSAPLGPFELPGGLSANEMGDHLARRFGLLESDPHVSDMRQAAETSLPYFERLKAQAGRPFKQSYEESVSRSFPHVSSCPVPELQAIYRQKLWRYFNHAMSFKGDMICVSAEGIGKTWALFDLMQHEALDTAVDHDDGKTRFFVFAFRSRAQAEEKAAEYSNNYRRAFVLKPFWAHYEDACIRVGARPRLKEEFDEESDIVSVLGQIKRDQPTVYDELKSIRKSLWLAGDGTSLFTGTTLIFTTHATAMAWHQTHMNRAWHHPQFSLESDSNRLKELREQFVFEKVVFDEPEWDEFVYLLSRDLYAHLLIRSRWAWQQLSVRERRDRFQAMKTADSALGGVDFEEYNELRFLDPVDFELVQVDYFAQPFGRENSQKSIYLGRHGTTYYFGAKRWPRSSGSTHWVFLTTETFTTEAIAALYDAKLGRSLLRLNLDNLPGLYPVDVPVVKNKKAKAEMMQELASEILASSDGTVVIADGLGSLRGERARSFQGMKGYNGWPEKDVFIVLTFLAPEVYARLNTLGIWLGLADTITKYYAAQLSQAVGRNTGFRKKRGTKTVVVTTGGLFRLIQTKLARFAPRVRLESTPDTFW
jgi:hypothetical protein